MTIKLPAPDIESLLRFYQEHRLTRAINILFSADGDVHVSLERERSMSFYGETGTDVVETMRKAMKPDKITIRTVEARAKPVVDEDDDDDLSVI